ncbi:MAG TPA: DUF4079 family protein, partial [Syntrophorhabdaceae bacterium]|nr:DUF4079 family protein [Syntrophorhabdaceae bacterium]
IRSQRRTGRLQFDVVRRHRRFGPILICVAAIGYVSGLVLVYIDEGNLIEYPLHLFFGSLAVFLLLVQYTMSTAIRGTQSPWRAPHFYTGVGTLCVYGVQLVIGTGILF